MRSVMLEQLYSGNIGAAHMRPYETEHSKYYRNQSDSLQKQLEEKLDEQGRRLLTQLQEAETGEEESIALGCFIHGFKLATLIMAEVFTDKECEMYNPRNYWHSRVNPRSGTAAADEK